jgi:glycerophosphoryl diester phosphodiesterase
VTRGRHVLALFAAAAACALPAGTAAAADNQWLGKRVLNQIHQGGENEAPSNTLFAYHDGLSTGGDMIELDVLATKDRQLVAIHDDSVDRTTNGSGKVSAMTLAQLRRLDAAHWFVPGRNAVRGHPAADYPYRGVRTGRKPPPAGFGPEDFRIPTLAEVLDAFPDVPTNIEIKGGTRAEKLRVADLLAAFLKRSGRKDVIVASFEQEAIDRFRQKAPQIDVAPGIGGISGWLLGGGTLPPGTKALQIPIFYDLGGLRLEIVTRERVAKAHAEGVAIHVWLDKSEENDEVYGRLADMCVDGVMTAEPTKYEAFLQRRNLPRTGGQGGAPGSDGCAAPATPPSGCRVRASAIVPPRGGKVAVRVQRYGDLRGTCRAKVSLTGRRATGRGPRGKAVALASGTVSIPAGRIAAFGQLKLTKGGRALLRGGRPVSVRAVVKASRRDSRTFLLGGR